MNPPTATAYKVQFLTSQGNAYFAEESGEVIKITVYQNSTSTRQALDATGRNPVIPSPSDVAITNGK